MLRVADIQAAFDAYNIQLFGGRLTQPRILVRNMKTDLARWYTPDAGRPRGCIVLAGNKRHPGGWRASLVHEMVHVAIAEEENDDHGPLFTAECNRVGAILGVEPCEVWDSWNWPSHHEDVEPADGSSANFMDED